MDIKEISQKEIWENFLAGGEEKTFLGSWNWGEFQKLEGNKIWRWGMYEGQSLLAVVLVVKIQAKRGTFLFVPHGPVLISQGKTSKFSILETLLKNLRRLAKEEKADFIRIAPILERKEENIKIFKDLGFKAAPIHMHPELTWELDLAKKEEEILAGMRKTTRYLIKQGQKNKDIQVVQSRDAEDLNIFDQIYKETASRHHFVPFSLAYLKNEFFSFKNDNEALIFSGKYKNKVVSSAVIIYWQGVGFYHQGASLSEYNKFPVSYLLQWEAIKEAKNRGCKIYNFWGIAENSASSVWRVRKHPWAGLSLFKMGFGGGVKEYVKTQDFVISPSYYLNYFIEKVRKIKRGL